MEDKQVQSPVISHSDPVLHTVRDTNGLPLPHPAEQPREVIERALEHNEGLTVAPPVPETMPSAPGRAEDNVAETQVDERQK
jgi:hypothetical protein